MAIRLTRESLDTDAAQLMVAGALAELEARYGPVTNRSGHGQAITSEDFEPPRGAFYVVWSGDTPIGSGGFRAIASNTEFAEVKRMYVVGEHRRQGVGQTIMAAIETGAAASGYRGLRLETGTEQPEAISLYRVNGFEPIEPWPEAPTLALSLYFEKIF